VPSYYVGARFTHQQWFACVFAVQPFLQNIYLVQFCATLSKLFPMAACVNLYDLLFANCRKTLEQQVGSSLRRTTTPSQICPSRGISLIPWPCMKTAHGATTRNFGMRRMCQSLCRHLPCLGFQCCHNTLPNLCILITFDVSWLAISFIWFGLRSMHISAEILSFAVLLSYKKAAMNDSR